MDVVIIGSGAGGGASAWALAQQGVNVLVLEAGPAYDPYQDYQLHQPDWELQRFPDKQKHPLRYSFGEMQPLEQKYDRLRSWNHIRGLSNRSDTRIPYKYHHVQGVGGSTLHFTGEAHRLHPKAFHMSSQYGVAADWPLSYEDLEDDYATAERVVGVSGKDKFSQRPRTTDFPLPPHPASYASQKIMAHSDDTGLKWDFNSLATLSVPYDGRPGCNYCNNCNRGCPRKDKGSVDVTFLHIARLTGRCQIQSNSTVLRIVSGDNDRVKGVEYVDQAGVTRLASAEVVIVACGTIETPRLLLLSGEENGYSGLANESGMIGKNFMETLFWNSAGLHAENLGSYRGLPVDIISWSYNAPDSIPGVVGGCRFGMGVSEADLVGPVNYAQRVVKGWGLQHKQEMRKSFGRVLSVNSIGESLPNPKSFIALDESTKDRFGRPVAKISSFLNEGEISRLKFMANKCREVLHATGVTDIIEEYGSYDFFSSTHVFGTARMGNDPEASVVNAHCQSHRWKNLFIVDASVFPSSGGGEAPSLTVEALAIRTARYIKDYLNA